MRTAIGVTALAFYVVLFLAGSQDIGAQKMAVAIPRLTLVLQIMVVVIPVLAGALAWKLCHDLAGADALEERKERIRERTESGERPEPPPAPPPSPPPADSPPLVFRLIAGVLTAGTALRRALGRPNRPSDRVERR